MCGMPPACIYKSSIIFTFTCELECSVDAPVQQSVSYSLIFPTRMVSVYYLRRWWSEDDKWAEPFRCQMCFQRLEGIRKLICQLTEKATAKKPSLHFLVWLYCTVLYPTLPVAWHTQHHSHWHSTTTWHIAGCQHAMLRPHRNTLTYAKCTYIIIFTLQ